MTQFPHAGLRRAARMLAIAALAVVSLSAAVQAGTKLFVGNLKFEIDEQALKGMFLPYGDVESVQLIRDRASGRSRGFGFVVMSAQEDAEMAINDLHGGGEWSRGVLEVRLAR